MIFDQLLVANVKISFSMSVRFPPGLCMHTCACLCRCIALCLFERAVSHDSPSHALSPLPLLIVHLVPMKFLSLCCVVLGAVPPNMQSHAQIHLQRSILFNARADQIANVPIPQAFWFGSYS